jgi:hypothetical protein
VHHSHNGDNTSQNGGNVNNSASDCRNDFTPTYDDLPRIFNNDRHAYYSTRQSADD